jgi:MarR family transcriptional regulator for hemolysin
MNINSNENIKEPVGRIMKKISMLSQTFLQENLTDLDIKRSFYPLLLIESGNGITQQELAGKLSCDKVQVVRIIDYLSSHGYVERIQNRTDKRKYELSITEKAKKVIPNIRKAFDEISVVTLKGLSETQRNELYTMLTMIETNFLTHKNHSSK